MIVFLFWTLNSVALAWGPEGHAVIAEIAQGHLKPEILLKIDAIRHAKFDLELIHPDQRAFGYKTDEGLDRFVSAQNLDLADIASWADGIRHRQGYEKTAPWHFVNVPVHGQFTHADIPAFCPGGNCVAVQLKEQFMVLSDGSAGAMERFEALCYLVHLTGDIHQPLHCADNGDEGGNQSPILFFGKSGKQIQLHSLWDDLIIAKYMDEKKLKSSIDLKDDVLSHALPADRMPQQDLDYLAWAFESYQIARTRIYPAYHGPSTEYGQPCVEEMMPLIEGQLAKAGLRLAYVLEQALKGSVTPPAQAAASQGQAMGAQQIGTSLHRRLEDGSEISKFFQARDKRSAGKKHKASKKKGSSDE